LYSKAKYVKFTQIKKVHDNLKNKTFLQKLDIFGFFEKDPFGNSIFVKRVIICVLGYLTFYRLNIANRLKVSGTENIANLPDEGVLFLSNHQTYFADVISLFHIFCSVKWGFKNNTWPPIYFLWPKAKMYYVAAAETMNEGGLIPKVFAQAGALTVERSWRAQGKNVKREVDKSAGDKVDTALKYGWVISFPQGTTSAYAPVRKGTAHMIKTSNPIVVPVVINGFRRAFDKKGLFLKKRNSTLYVTFKAPIRFGVDDTVESIVERITEELGQEIPEWKLKEMEQTGNKSN
jgi:1-acyl-sn-glycerol-3-phosphate acyltransferase